MVTDSRDDFPRSVKEALAKRVGYRCSFPGCDLQTVGPSSEEPTAASNTGIAAHIVAAASGPGARRADPNLSSAQRSSYENGIWMCSSHGVLIDKDEHRFTVPLLKEWRRTAERKAELRQAYGQFDIRIFKLFSHEGLINLDNLGEKTVHELLIHAGVFFAWGDRIGRAVRDAVFEIAQNALSHGKANWVLVKTTPVSVLISDDGTIFNPNDLLRVENSRGGARAISELKGQLGDALLTSASYGNGLNTFQIQYVRSLEDITKATPCHIDGKHIVLQSLFMGELADLDAFKGCETIYILLPQFISFSKAVSYSRAGELLAAMKGDRQIIFVGQEISEGVERMLSRVPGSRFLHLENVEQAI
jgi:hypothetical protein